MKKITVFAASLATMILLTACPHKPDEPQPLQLSDVVGRYEGTLTVEVQPFSDTAMQTLTYAANGKLYQSDIGGIDPSLSFRLDWWVAWEEGNFGHPSATAGEFQGEVTRTQEQVMAPQSIATRWGRIGLYPSDKFVTYRYAGVELRFTGEDLTLTYADTVRGFADNDGMLRDFLLRSVYTLTKTPAL